MIIPRKLCLGYTVILFLRLSVLLSATHRMFTLRSMKLHKYVDLEIRLHLCHRFLTWHLLQGYSPLKFSLEKLLSPLLLDRSSDFLEIE